MAAIEVLLEQLFVQYFRNVVPAKVADEVLADWEKTALDVVKEHAGSSSYVREFYSEIRGALDHIRNKPHGVA